MSKPNVYITCTTKDINYKSQLLSSTRKHNIFKNIERSKITYQIKPSAKDIDIIHTMQNTFMSNVDIVIVLIGNSKISRSEYLYDWDIASALNCDDNKKRSFIIILLPDTLGLERVYSSDSEKTIIHDWDMTSEAEVRWNKISFLYPSMPSRLIDNLMYEKIKIDVVKWNNIFSDINVFKKILMKSLDYRNENNYQWLRPLIHNSLMK